MVGSGNARIGSDVLHFCAPADEKKGTVETSGYRLIRVLHSPSPLPSPQGEGETFAYPHTICGFVVGSAAPSPWGEGRGEGELDLAKLGQNRLRNAVLQPPTETVEEAIVTLRRASRRCKRQAMMASRQVIRILTESPNRLTLRMPSCT